MLQRLHSTDAEAHVPLACMLQRLRPSPHMSAGQWLQQPWGKVVCFCWPPQPASTYPAPLGTPASTLCFPAAGQWSCIPCASGRLSLQLWSQLRRSCSDPLAFSFPGASYTAILAASAVVRGCRPHYPLCSICLCESHLTTR